LKVADPKVVASWNQKVIENLLTYKRKF